MSLLNNFDFSLDEDAVSPVVGVILMVAITVILAAVIGTFVLDLGGQVQQNAQAGVTFDETEGVDTTVQLNSVQSADHIYVTAPDANDVSGGEPTATDNVSTYDTSYDGQYLLTMSQDSTATDPTPVEVGGAGTTVTVTHGSNDGQISVIGVLDGSESVIQTYSYVGSA